MSGVEQTNREDREVSEIKIVESCGRDPAKCRHFNGIGQKKCKAGIDYLSKAVDHEPIRYQNAHDGRVRPGVYSCCRSFPCGERLNMSGTAKCDKYDPFTAEENAAHEAEIKRSHDLMARGLSSCCEAPIDESQVIRAGRHKGHGPRYCSKCGRCVLIV